MCSNTRKTSCYVHGVFAVAFASLAISKEMSITNIIISSLTIKRNEAMKRNLYRVLVVSRRFVYNHENKVVICLSVLTLLGIVDLLLLITGAIMQ